MRKCNLWTLCPQVEKLQPDIKSRVSLRCPNLMGRDLLGFGIGKPVMGKSPGGIGMAKKSETITVDEPLYHDTWKLLKKYRDVVWSLELSVQQVRNRFEIEYGNTIEDFLDSVYLAGADIAGSDIEHHAQCIERSHKMLKLLDNAIDLLRNKHKNGESYYWLLYYTFLSPQQMRNVDEIIEKLRPHIRDISLRTYYRKRQECIGALSSILWGYTSKDSMDVLEQFVPGK